MSFNPLKHEIANNNIEVIQVEEYSHLGRLDISGNNIKFFSDIKVPSTIRHLVLSHNQLENLD